MTGLWRELRSITVAAQWRGRSRDRNVKGALAGLADTPNAPLRSRLGWGRFQLSDGLVDAAQAGFAAERFEGSK